MLVLLSVAFLASSVFSVDVDCPGFTKKKFCVQNDPPCQWIKGDNICVERASTSAEPTGSPTASPTGTPTDSPTAVPTGIPSGTPTGVPTSAPSAVPTGITTDEPTSTPTASPTSVIVTEEPTSTPSAVPTSITTDEPTSTPTGAPTMAPVSGPTSDDCPSRGDCCTCVDDLGCSWLQGKGRCAPRDLSRPNWAQEKAQCQQPTCPGVTPDCPYFSKKFCSKVPGCIYTKAKTCENIVTSGCGQYYDKDPCNNATENCEWKGKHCEDAPVKTGCAAITDQKVCKATEGCKYGKGECKDEPEKFNACSDYHNIKNQCKKHKPNGCKWVKETKQCEEYDCTLVTRAKDCKEINKCFWDRKIRTCFLRSD